MSDEVDPNHWSSWTSDDEVSEPCCKIPSPQTDDEWHLGPPGWARNRFTFRAEVPPSMMTPEQNAEAERHHQAWLNEQPWWRDRNKFSKRVKRVYRKVKWRLGDVWGVLLHGLPDPHDY